MGTKQKNLVLAAIHSLLSGRRGLAVKNVCDGRGRYVKGQVGEFGNGSPPPPDYATLYYMLD